MKQGLKFKLSTVAQRVSCTLSTTISKNTWHIQIPPLQACVSSRQDWNSSPRGTAGGGSHAQVVAEYTRYGKLHHHLGPNRDSLWVFVIETAQPC